MFNTQKWWRQWRRRHTYIELHSSAAADNISASSFFGARFHFEKEIFHSIRLALFSLHCLWHGGRTASVYESHTIGGRVIAHCHCLQEKGEQSQKKNAITVNVKCNKTMKNFQFKCRSVKRDDILLRAMVYDGGVTRHTASERVIECTGRIGKGAHKWILYHKKSISFRAHSLTAPKSNLPMSPFSSSILHICANHFSNFPTATSSFLVQDFQVCLNGVSCGMCDDLEF